MRRVTLRIGAICLSLVAALGQLGCEPIQGLGVGASPASGALRISDDDRLLVVASEDHDQLLIIDRASRQVLHRVAVSDGPTHVVLDQGRAVVTARYGHAVDVVDIQRGEKVRTISVGVEPYGLTFIGEGKVAVALAGEQAVALVDIDEGRVDGRIALAHQDPRAIARLANGRLVVSHMATGEMSQIDLATRTVQTLSVTTTNQLGPSIEAEHLRSLTITPDEARILLPHSQANTLTVRAPIGAPAGEMPPDGPGMDCGYSGCPAELPAVSPAITEVDVESGEVVIPEIVAENGDTGGVMPMEVGMDADCMDCGAPMFMGPQNPPSVLNPNEARFLGVPLNNPVALALFDGGNGQAVVHMGSRNVLFLRRELKGQARDVLGVADVGHGASAIAVTHAGDLAYVWNQFDGSLTEIPLFEVETGGGQSRFATEEDRRDEPALFMEPQKLASETFVVVEDALPALASEGRKLFHDALDTRISANRSISCATCHPDGRTDGRTWRFTFGPRNTPQLGGGILDTAPFHWPGDVENIRSLNDMTVLAFMGGTGLDPQSMDAIGAFIDQIKAAPSPAALQDGLTEAQARGKAIFEDPMVGCTACHTGRHFTDNRGWDIGSNASRAGMEDISVFQTPVLHGLARSAPYLHDGSAQTLYELVDQWVRTDRMGTGSHLDETALLDLAEYLETL